MVQKLNKYTGNIGIGLNFQPTGSSGLNISHTGGAVAGSGAILETVAGNITVPGSTAWTVYVNLVTGVLTSVATVSLPTSDILILWDGTSSSSDVTLIRDVRSWTSTGNAIGPPIGFNSLLGQYNMVFEYAFNSGAGLDAVNTGSAGSDHDLAPGGTDPLRGITGGDVNGSTAVTVGVDANNQTFGHDGTMPSDFTDWDALASTGSAIVIFRTTQARAFDNFIIDNRDLPSGFFTWRLATVGDPDGRLGVDVIRSTNSQDSRIISNVVLPINDGEWYVAVITQPGDGNGMRMYIDGIDVGQASGVERDNWFPNVAQNWDSFDVGAAAGTTSPFKGDLDYFAVTETVLTQDQARELYFAYNGLTGGTALQDILDTYESNNGPRIQYNFASVEDPIVNQGTATLNDLTEFADGGAFNGNYLQPGASIDNEGVRGAITGVTQGGLRKNSGGVNWSSGGATNAGTWIWILDMTGAADGDWLGGCTLGVDTDGVQCRITTGGSNSALSIEYRVQDSGTGDSTRLYDPVGTNDFGSGTGYHVWAFRQDGIGTEFPDLFIDGVLINPSDLTDFTGTCPIDYWFGSFVKNEGNVFRRGNVTGNALFGGGMDMMIYTNDVLTDQQILDMSNAALLQA